MNLRGLSFHSVKGGVGKSTLATMAAVQCARERPDQTVYLIDMDLTGTSLADVLPLQAPRWLDGASLTHRVLESVAPDDFDTVDGSRIRVDARAQELREHRHDAPGDLRVPFLNDFLLHEPTDYAHPTDVRLEALCWKPEAKPPDLLNLRIIPSSAIPGDLDRIVPVIFDEQHAALLEARLETLIAMIVERHKPDDVTIVVDVPPTIPGLSRSVISLGLRLSASVKQPLARKGDVPEAFDGVNVNWTVHLVTSPDPQDLRATERWLTLVQEEERPRFRLVVNRHLWGSVPEEVQTALAVELGLTSSDAFSADPSRSLGGFEPYLTNALFFAADQQFTFFQKRAMPTVHLNFGGGV